MGILKAEYGQISCCFGSTFLLTEEVGRALQIINAINYWILPSSIFICYLRVGFVFFLSLQSRQVKRTPQDSVNELII